MIDALELRRHFSVTLSGSLLAIVGTAGANTISMSLVARGQTLRVDVDGDVRKFRAADVGAISVDAGAGNDRASFSDAYGGFAGPISLSGGDGNDTLGGSAGNDLIVGGAGNDRLAGGTGNDVLRGNGGKDRLEGSAGDDNVSGNAGVDVVLGGAGNDTFHDVDLLSERADFAAGDVLLIDNPATAPAVDWSAINDFTYQLQGADLAAIGQTKFDLAILDAANDDGVPWTKQQITDLRHSAGGEKRVLAYLSIGEAEDYRDYWKAAWDADHDGKPDAGAPSWLATQNPDWEGNYTVRYWDPAWQKIILKAVDDRVAQGFDGVYLDIVDAFETWGPDGNNQRPTAEQDMVNFVKAIAAEARRASGDPAFAVVPQNGEALGTHADYLAAITAIGHEDVFYDGDTKKDAGDVADLVTALDRFKNAAKPVFVIDYPKKLANIRRVYEAAAAHGYIAYCPRRDLDQLTINAVREPD